MLYLIWLTGVGWMASAAAVLIIHAVSWRSWTSDIVCAANVHVFARAVQRWWVSFGRRAPIVVSPSTATIPTVLILLLLTRLFAVCPCFLVARMSKVSIMPLDEQHKVLYFWTPQCFWLSLRQSWQNGVNPIDAVWSRSNSPDSTAAEILLMYMAVSVFYLSVDVDQSEFQPRNLDRDRCLIFRTRRPRGWHPVFVLGSQRISTFRNPTGCPDATYFLEGPCTTRLSVRVLPMIPIDARPPSAEYSTSRIFDNVDEEDLELLLGVNWSTSKHLRPYLVSVIGFRHTSLFECSDIDVNCHNTVVRRVLYLKIVDDNGVRRSAPLLRISALG